LSEYAVALVCKDSEQLASSALRAGSALKFVPHISIKGRFSAEPRALEDFILPSMARLARGLKIFMAELRGPKVITDLLYWMECEPGSSGYSQLIELHAWCEEALSAATTNDHTPQDFKLTCFRPHMTLGWFSRLDAQAALYRSRILSTTPFNETVVLNELCLFRYSGDPHRSAVDVVAIG
jgi:2'-5' RNA ligase superfamily